MDRLNLLPQLARRAAQAACAPGRTKVHLLAVLKLAGSGDISADTKLALLPVVYYNTNPARLPSRYSESPRNDDSELDEDIPTAMNERNILDVMCSQIALQMYAAIIELRAPGTGPAHESHSQLWARFWPWHLLVSSRSNRWIFSDDLYFLGRSIAFFYLVSTLAVQKPADCSHMLSTRGFRRNLAQGWAMLPEWSYAPADRNIAIRGIFKLLLLSEIHTSIAHQQEIIQGLGGSLVSAVELFRKTVKLLINHAEKKVFCNIGTVFFVLASLEKPPDQPVDKHYEASLGPIARALHSRTLIIQMTNVIAELLILIDTKTHVVDAMRALVHSLDSLGRYLLVHCPNYLADALAAGLLRSVLGCGMFRNPDQPQGSEKINAYAKWILRNVLYPQVNAFIQVARSMSCAAAQVQEILSSDQFRNSCLHETWELLAPILAARQQLVEKIDAQEDTGHRACDNIECPITAQRTDFRRCAGCQSSFYCSAMCQRADWKRGGHSVVCSRRRPSGSFLGASSGYDFKQRRFLRELLSDSFASDRSGIYLDQVELMANSAHLTEDLPHCAVFYDLRCAPGRDMEMGVYVYRLDEIHAKLHDLELNENDFEDIVRRARESRGRYQVHVACLPGLRPNEHRSRSVLVPLRSSGSELFSAMRRLAERHKSGAGIDEDVLKREVEQVLAEYPASDIIEFH
uniref:MYND-type domain-containing protein n=1 Tax=Mycena chlorophos TaxID=658473 RepID=A0ABQ0LG20_MYCCL|nr:predicted protein [Mycena chlorophos]